MEVKRKIVLATVKCLRCGAVWAPRVASPKKCKVCTSPYWWVKRGKLPQGAAAWQRKKK